MGSHDSASPSGSPSTYHSPQHEPDSGRFSMTSSNYDSQSTGSQNSITNNSPPAHRKQSHPPQTGKYDLSIFLSLLCRIHFMFINFQSVILKLE